MAKGDRFFLFYGGDWFTSDRVMSLSPSGECAFLRMLWIQHIEGSCPDDMELVALKTSTRTRKIKAGWEEARALFEVTLNGRLVNAEAHAKQSLRGPGRDVEPTDDPTLAERRKKAREKKQRQRQVQNAGNGPEEPGDNSGGQIPNCPGDKGDIERYRDKKDISSPPPLGDGDRVCPPWWDGHGLDDPHGLLASPKNDAFAIASLTLLAVAAKLDADPPTAEEVKRFLAKSSPLQALVRHYSATTDGPPDFREGCRKASLLAAWSMQADYQPNDGARIASQRAALEAKMRDDKRKTSGRSAAEIRDQIDLAPLEEILHQ